MPSYEAKRLREEFPQLKDPPYDNVEVIRMFNGLFYKWADGLEESQQVSDIRERMDNLGRDVTYDCVVDGKLVEVIGFGDDISSSWDVDECAYAVKIVSFRGNEEAARKLDVAFREFVRSQSLDDVVQAANEIRMKIHGISYGMKGRYT